ARARPEWAAIEAASAANRSRQAMSGEAAEKTLAGDWGCSRRARNDCSEPAHNVGPKRHHGSVAASLLAARNSDRRDRCGRRRGHGWRDVDAAGSNAGAGRAVYDPVAGRSVFLEFRATLPDDFTRWNQDRVRREFPIVPTLAVGAERKAHHGV